MSELTRISISLESALLDAFDRLISGKSYATRSEAIRDLIRDRLIREEAGHSKSGQVAVVILVYDHHVPDLAIRLIATQHHHHHLVVATMHVHLGERHCLEVTVLRGASGDIRHLGDDLVAAKGVLHGEVIMVGSEVDFSHWHGASKSTDVA